MDTDEEYVESIIESLQLHSAFPHLLELATFKLMTCYTSHRTTKSNLHDLDAVEALLSILHTYPSQGRLMNTCLDILQHIITHCDDETSTQVCTLLVQQGN